MSRASTDTVWSERRRHEPERDGYIFGVSTRTPIACSSCTRSAARRMRSCIRAVSKFL
jgi:hypothetical protein